MVAVFIAGLVRGGPMIDRWMTVAGLALAVFFGFGQYRWPKVPKWVTDIGIVAGGILIGINIAPLIWKFCAIVGWVGMNNKIIG